MPGTQKDIGFGFITQRWWVCWDCFEQRDRDFLKSNPAHLISLRRADYLKDSQTGVTRGIDERQAAAFSDKKGKSTFFPHHWLFAQAVLGKVKGDCERTEKLTVLSARHGFLRGEIRVKGEATSARIQQLTLMSRDWFHLTGAGAWI